MAKFYDSAIKKVEENCLSHWRRELLGNLSGDVLEIGSGTGVNLKYYPKTVNKLVLTEPDSNMRHILNKRIEESDRDNISMAHYHAESIDLPDESFDYVVSTLVLCSVKNPLNSLTELKRILRPNGQLILMEHVAADDNPKLLNWQKTVEPFWKWIGCNCHLTRQTEILIKQAGFNSIQIEKVSMLGAPSLVKPMIKGIAQKKT